MHTCVTSLILVERDSGNNLGSGYTGPPVDLPSYFETLFLPYGIRPSSATHNESAVAEYA